MVREGGSYGRGQIRAGPGDLGHSHADHGLTRGQGRWRASECTGGHRVGGLDMAIQPHGALVMTQKSRALL